MVNFRGVFLSQMHDSQGLCQGFESGFVDAGRIWAALLQDSGGCQASGGFHRCVQRRPDRPTAGLQALVRQ